MNESKEMLLRMIVKCKKDRKHKPRKVAVPVLEVGGLASTLFADSEVSNRSRTRTETDEVRRSLLKF